LKFSGHLIRRIQLPNKPFSCSFQQSPTPARITHSKVIPPAMACSTSIGASRVKRL
jgi:hypothetical protein